MELRSTSTLTAAVQVSLMRDIKVNATSRLVSYRSSTVRCLIVSLVTKGWTKVVILVVDSGCLPRRGQRNQSSKFPDEKKIR